VLDILFAGSEESKSAEYAFISRQQLISATATRGREMAKKATKIRPWTKEDVRTLKVLAREKVKTSAIARKLKRTAGATHQKAMRLGVKFGTSRNKKKG